MPKSRASMLSGLMFSLAVVLAFAIVRPAQSWANGASHRLTAQDKSQTAETSSTAKYVGADTCKACHDAEYSSWDKSAHWKTSLNSTGGPSKQGCESCHGPGSAHVDDPSDKTKIFVFQGQTSEKVNERCLSCHETGKEQMNFSRSEHAENNLNCTSCHSIHHAQTPEFLLAKSQPGLCFSCHLDKKAQFNMPWHHKVNEGLVKCTDCHNPHGSFQPGQLRTAAAQDAVCFKCHEDKQGPFVYEHEPVKTEGCVACHVPHGSANPHLLKYANVNQLCLQCHTASLFSAAPGTPNFHNMTTQFQACVLCHTQIHGSNLDPVFGR